MQIKIEEIKKMLKDLSLNNTKASAPNICAKVVLVPFAFGGVSGKKKLSKPKAIGCNGRHFKSKGQFVGANMKHFIDHPSRNYPA